MSSLEDTVRLVVQDFVGRSVLFTALDVSNAVKQQMPHARHREVRDAVRGMFSTDIETQGWARTPITVNLEDGTTAEALLYHPLTSSWDLDNEYGAQQRAATSFRPTTAAQAVVAQAQAQTVPATTAATAPVVAPAPAPAPARALWDQMFQSQPSLFPKP
jgi:hypothetical protein